MLTVQGCSQLEQSVRCGCHVKVKDHTTRKAVIKLVVASLVALMFMVGEVLGKEGGRGKVEGGKGEGGKEGGGRREGEG